MDPVLSEIVYGASLFTMGVAVWSRTRQQPDDGIARAYVWLAGFGVVEGARASIAALTVAGHLSVEIPLFPPLAAAAFAMLMRFGIAIRLLAGPGRPWERHAPAGLTILWLGILLVDLAVWRSGGSVSDIALRALLAVPAAGLVGLLLLAKRYRHALGRESSLYLHLMGFVFAIFAFKAARMPLAGEPAGAGSADIGAWSAVALAVLAVASLRVFDTVERRKFAQTIRATTRIIEEDALQRRARLEAAERIQARLAEAQHIAHLGSWELDAASSAMWWSEELFIILARDSAEGPLKLDEFLNLAHPDDRAGVWAAVEGTLGRRVPFSLDHRVVLRDGDQRVVHQTGDAIVDAAGGVVGIAAVIQDVTGRAKAEEALRRSLRDHEILSSIMTFSLQPLALRDLLARVLEVVLSNHGLGLESKGCIFLSDEETGDLVMETQRGLDLALQVSCTRLPMGRCLCGRAAATGEMVFVDALGDDHEIAYEGIRPHGHYCVPIRDEGEVLGVMNFYVPEGHVRTTEEERFVRTIAATLAVVIRRKRAEERHIKAEERYRAVSESATDAIIAIDAFGNVVSWNRGAAVMFGYCEDEMRGKPLNRVIPERYRLAHESGLQALREESRPPHLIGSMIEIHGRRKTGEEFPVELAVGRWTADGATFYTGIIRDSSKRKQGEEELRRARDELEVRVQERTRKLEEEIVERKRAEGALRQKTEVVALLHRATLDANEASSADEAMRSCLADICRFTGWPVGHVCILDPNHGGVMLSSGVWHSEDPVRYAVLRTSLEGAVHAKGHGLSGRVLATKRAAWTGNLGDDTDFPGREVAKRLGLAGGIALPVLVRAEVVATMEFFLEGPLAVDEAVLEAVGSIGTQLGRVVERKQAEEGMRLASMVFENSLHGMIVTDAGGTIVSVNPAFTTVTGYGRDEAIGSRPSMLRSGRHDEAFYRQMWQGLVRDDQWRGEIWNRRKNGDVYPEWLEITTIRGAGGRVDGYLGIFTDITKRHAAEQELRAAKEQADAANRAKSEFLSNMSHELRTPMNAILGFGQLLEFNPKEPLTPAQKDYVAQILKAGDHLLELINEVLDLAKIESGKVALSIETVPTRQVIEECLNIARLQADSHGVRLNGDAAAMALPAIRADRTRFKQILLNLLSNAVKYNREGGEVALDCETVANGAHLRIRVSDTGHGIPEERWDDLFQPFNRLGAEASEIEGTGIGLTVTRQLVRLMEGDIGFESRLGEGSVFWIDLPVAGPAINTDGTPLLP